MPDHWPRPLDELDRLLGADPDGSATGAPGCYEPKLPGAAAIEDALRRRYDERWADYWGEVGERLRVLEADGHVVLDRRRGAVLDPASGRPLANPPDGGGSPMTRPRSPRRTAGLAVIVVSAAMTVVGMVGIIGSLGDDGARTSASPTPPASTSTTLAPATTTTQPTTAATPPATTTTALPATTTTTAAPVGESPAEFFATWVEANHGHDVAFLVARLHPLVIDRYGDEQCRGYLDAIDGSRYAVEVLSVAPGTAPWVWALDGLETTVADAITVQLRRTEDGTTFFEAEVHVAAIGPEIRWFTDCGTPLEGAS